MVAAQIGVTMMDQLKISLMAFAVPITDQLNMSEHIVNR